MISFFKTTAGSVIAVQMQESLPQENIDALCWLFGGATALKEDNVNGFFIGPRREMITPWSTNAVEITQNMGIKGVERIEEYFPVDSEQADYDPMLQRMYKGLDAHIFEVNIKPAPIKIIENIEEYNEEEGLALSPEEIEYLHKVEGQLGRKLTDSEVFGFAQINSEHCRHKIFGGTFIIDGKEVPCVRDEEELKTRQGTNDLGVTDSTLLLFTPVYYIRTRKEPGDTMMVNSKTYVIDDWKVNAGMNEIALHRSV